MNYEKMESINSCHTMLEAELITDSFSGPITKRKATNKEFLILFVVFLAIWLLLVFYCIANGDLSRLRLELTDQEASALTKFAQNIKICGWEIYFSCSFAAVISLLLILLFRYFAGFIVWLVMGTVITLFTVLSIGSWAAYFTLASDGNGTTDKTNSLQDFETGTELSTSSRDDVAEATGFLFPAIIFTCITIGVSLVIYGLRKNIKMIIRLFIEAGKVTHSIPLVILQPLVTLSNMALILSLCVYFFLWIESSGTPNDSGQYEKDQLMEFARGYNFMAAFWLTQFLLGCQHMVIAGITATWFFTRDKSNVRQPIATSYSNLLKYHLGSVVLGSLIILLVKFLRMLARSMENRNSRNPVACLIACIFRMLFAYIEKFVVFLTRNAYIEMAIFGEGFWDSGKRAFQVITNNFLKTLSINSIGDFVLLLGKALITGLSVLFGYFLLKDKPGVTDLTVPLSIIGLFAYIVSNAFVSAFEMIIDSIFICFCEDCEMNDGKERPYYMSQDLMIFIENKERVLRVGDAVAQQA